MSASPGLTNIRDRMLIEMATVLELLLAETVHPRPITSADREMFDFHLDRLIEARQSLESRT